MNKFKQAFFNDNYYLVTNQHICLKHMKIKVSNSLFYYFR